MLRVCENCDEWMEEIVVSDEPAVISTVLDTNDIDPAETVAAVAEWVRNLAPDREAS
jgi:hypothetical protein